MSRRGGDGSLARPLLLLLVVCLVAGTGCAARKKRKEESARILAPAELYERAMTEIAEGRLRNAKTYLERVQYTAKDRASMEPLVRLALADLAFYTGDDLSLIDARAKYLDFVSLYGDHPRAPYAQLQAGVCALKQTADPSRDQSQTLVAINDLREVERRYPTSPYVAVAEQELVRAESTLAEHDYEVGRFYFRKKAYLPAVDRFRSLLDKYPKYLERDKVYFYMGDALLRMDNFAEAAIYFDKLLADFPRSPYSGQARRLGELSRGAGEKGQKEGR